METTQRFVVCLEEGKALLQRQAANEGRPGLKVAAGCQEAPGNDDIIIAVCNKLVRWYQLDRCLAILQFLEL